MKRLETTRTNDLGELMFCALYNMHSYWIAGNVEPVTASRIKKDTGLELKGYRIVLYSEGLSHLLNRHYSEPGKKQRGVKYKDIGRIGNVVNRYNTVEFSKRTDRLVFKRRFPDGTLSLVVEIDHANKVLSGITLWIRIDG